MEGLLYAALRVEMLLPTGVCRSGGASAAFCAMMPCGVAPGAEPDDWLSPSWLSRFCESFVYLWRMREGGWCEREDGHGGKMGREKRRMGLRVASEGDGDCRYRDAKI